MIILIRILLVILPIALLIVWMRWRAKVSAGGEMPENETRRLRRTLIIIIVALVATGSSLKIFDGGGSVDGVYVPARMENGILIPGHFDSVQEEASKKADPAVTPEENEPSTDGSSNEGSSNDDRADSEQNKP
ncbi:MAG: hypothetical protein JKY34_03395 [Kordiimonadaceae bacterium]|nr:hypothetical protein [Kordiimonadaceae bacterium]